MNKHEINKIAMYQSVDSVLERHDAIVGNPAALAAAITKYRQSIDTIKARDVVYTVTTTGATTAKHNAADALADKALVCAKALYAMGVATGNEQLKAETDLTHSKLTGGRRGELQQRATRIIALAEEQTDALAEYGITGETVTELKSALERMQTATGEQAQRMAENKAARSQLTEAFAVTDRILKDELDSLMLLVKDDTPDCYGQYKAARVIRDLGGSHPVKHSVTGDAEKGVNAAA